ncbi:MAG: tetratricopeptide repeat protein [Phycisphaerales bacterium]|nr:MAG: tetratricopeptide repeat protein [Phycisphaerales bacterium]
MAPLECQECKAPLSKSAENCPLCGASVRDRKAGKRKPWYERTSVTLCVAAGLLVVALGFVHIVIGVESPFRLPVDIVRRESFGYRETFIDARAIAALPYTAAKLKYPLSCEVLQRRGYLPSGRHFEARTVVRQMQDIGRWQAEFTRTLGPSEPPWEERLQTGIVEEQADPESAQADNARGIASARNGEYQAALAAFSRAIRKAPAYAEAFHNRALVYIALGNLGQGAADFDKVVEIRPGYIEGYVEQGRLYLKTGQQEDAVAVFSRAIEVDSTCAEAYLGRALACYVQGQYDRAWQDVRQLEYLGTPAPAGFVVALSHASGRDPGT